MADILVRAGENSEMHVEEGAWQTEGEIAS